MMKMSAIIDNRQQWECRNKPSSQSKCRLYSENLRRWASKIGCTTKRWQNKTFSKRFRFKTLGLPSFFVTLATKGLVVTTHPWILWLFYLKKF